MSDFELIFEGTAVLSQWGLSAMVCLGAAWLIILLMRYERQLVPRGVGVTLLALRLTVLAMLMVTLLQPMLSRTTGRQQNGRVIVAADVSESMETVDEYATNAELLRTARAIGVVGNAAVADRLDGLIAAWEAGNEPVWVSESEATTPQHNSELAELRRATIEQALDTVRRLPRREIVRRLLVESPQPLLARLRTVGDVDLRLFAASSETAVTEESQSLLNLPPALLRSSTDLAACLNAAADSESSPLAGIIVFSDGRHTADTDPVEAASHLGLLSVPVIPVLIGSEQQPKDISIQSVEHPQVVFHHDSLSVRVRAFAAGYSGEELTLTLTHPNGTEETQTLAIPANGPPMLDAQFALTADKPGQMDYQLKIDDRPGETRHDNNVRLFSVNVVDDQSNVLLVDGEARWDFRFLHTALERDERINVTPVVFNQPYLGVLPDTFFSRELPFDPHQFDEQHSPLVDFDLIIVGDVSPREFDSNAWAIVEHWVRELGGTLVLAAGREDLPRRHESPSLDRLLPVSELRELSISDAPPTTLPDEIGFRLALTDDGANEEFLRLDANPQKNRRLWQSLPGHLWGLTGSARPTATVLLTADGLPHASPASPPSGVTPLERERQTGILVHQYLGFGQVLWLGIDSTWRWRHRRGDELHHRFWGQITRWATRNRTSAGNDVVRLSLSSTHVDPGEPVTVRARWQRSFLDKHPDLKAAVEFFSADRPPRETAAGRKPSGPSSSAQLQPRDAGPALQRPDGLRRSAYSGNTAPLRIDLSPNLHQPDVFEAVVRMSDTGSWTARLVITGAELDAPVDADLFVAQPRIDETADLTANRDLLTSVAAASANGQMLLPDQLDEIIPLLNLSTNPTAGYQVDPLWNHWLVMLAVFALLTTEWTLRKLNGLP
jgi:hypothetical protein